MIKSLRICLSASTDATRHLYGHCGQRALSSTKRGNKEHIDYEGIYKDIQERIQRSHLPLFLSLQEYKRLTPGHYRSRELQNNLFVLRKTMAEATQRKRAALATTQFAPAESGGMVVSNGTTQVPPCVMIRTPFRCYLFNCPENTVRFLPPLRTRGNVIHDIFLTRGSWDQIGGISAIMLSKDPEVPPTRIHGSVSMRSFLECIRPFQDADYGNVKYPSQVEERTYEQESYEDIAIRVRYIPLAPPPGTLEEMQARGFRKQAIDVAYLVELKEPSRRIDPFKLIELQIPKGPLIGKLKSGEMVQLPDGRQIRPEQVYADGTEGKEEGALLVVDCASRSHFEALRENSVLKEFLESGERPLRYCVHFTPEEILRSDDYEQWRKSLGEQCTHIVVNGTGPVLPTMDSVYKHQGALESVAPQLFPPLVPRGFRGVVTQKGEYSVVEPNGLIRATSLQRWPMRGTMDEADPILLDLRKTEPEIAEEDLPTFQNAVKNFSEFARSLEQTTEYPKVSFLGTSSAMPSKYRNVSGYLLELSENSAILVDVGEGTYGQLRCLLDDEECNKLLTHLRAVFITHAHQDHMNGLFMVIQRRKDAFQKLGVAYEPLTLVCNKNVMKPLKTYSMVFEDLLRDLETVDLSIRIPPEELKYPPRRDLSPPSRLLSAVTDVIPRMPRPLFNESKWNLKEIRAVQVHHTRMANGFVFVTVDGKKLVFSGDTKPCELLAKEGLGADLLVHEATFEDDHVKDAERKRHSTMEQAVGVSKKMKAKHVILSHFSARYPKVPDLPKYLDEMGNVGVAMDNMVVRFDSLPLVPKLLSIYREMFRAELFEIEMRRDQRRLKKKMAEEEGRELKEEEEMGNGDAEEQKESKRQRRTSPKAARSGKISG